MTLEKLSFGLNIIDGKYVCSVTIIIKNSHDGPNEITACYAADAYSISKYGALEELERIIKTIYDKEEMDEVIETISKLKQLYKFGMWMS